jgi:hypothetical protein
MQNLNCTFKQWARSIQPKLRYKTNKLRKLAIKNWDSHLPMVKSPHAWWKNVLRFSIGEGFSIFRAPVSKIYS